MSKPESSEILSLEDVLAKITASDSRDLGNIHRWQDRVKFSKSMVDHRRAVHHFSDFFFYSRQVAGATLVQLRLLSFYALTFIGLPVPDEDVEKIVLGAAEKVLGEKFPVCFEAYKIEKELAKNGVAGVATTTKKQLVAATGGGPAWAGWKHRHVIPKKRTW